MLQPMIDVSNDATREAEGYRFQRPSGYGIESIGRDRAGDFRRRRPPDFVSLTVSLPPGQDLRRRLRSGAEAPGGDQQAEVGRIHPSIAVEIGRASTRR
ncbi:MAG: hypothetical protein CMJ27_05680 [Phycisphaerae bacterium]|nr:hypothetical protein [Phycisphaerae bacterium]